MKPSIFGRMRRRVSLEECYLLTRQLHILQKSGVPILSSLDAIREQVDGSAGLRDIVRAVHQDLLEGKALSLALARYPEAFGPVYLGLIKAGEAGGLLEQMLHQLARLLEWDIDVRQRLREALQYPVIVLTTLAMAVAAMMVFVLPRFAQMFQSFRISLPLQTRALIAVSNLLSHHGWLIALLLAACATGWWAFLRTERGRFRWHRWKFRIPILGPLMMQVAMSRVARVIAALTRSGVPILETLGLAGESLNNQHLRRALARVRERIKAGRSLAQAMRSDGVFPALVTQMVATGEASGRLDELLQSVSEYYDQQVTYSLKRLIACLEPLLLLMVGFGVLLMATAVFLPMWDLVQVFKQHGR